MWNELTLSRLSYVRTENAASAVAPSPAGLKIGPFIVAAAPTMEDPTMGFGKGPVNLHEKIHKELLPSDLRCILCPRVDKTLKVSHKSR